VKCSGLGAVTLLVSGGENAVLLVVVIFTQWFMLGDVWCLCVLRISDCVGCGTGAANNPS
jgi:hypothetical protein